MAKQKVFSLSEVAAMTKLCRIGLEYDVMVGNLKISGGSLFSVQSKEDWMFSQKDVLEYLETRISKCSTILTNQNEFLYCIGKKQRPEKPKLKDAKKPFP